MPNTAGFAVSLVCPDDTRTLHEIQYFQSLTKKVVEAAGVEPVACV